MKTVKLLLAFIFVAGVAYGQAKKGPLDKKIYTCEVTQDGKKKATPVKDDLKFATGKFNCKTMTEEGYKTAAYEAEVDSSSTPPTYTFRCESADGEDSFTWEGTIDGEGNISGTATITKKGKTKKSFTYTGSQKGKKAPK